MDRKEAAMLLKNEILVTESAIAYCKHAGEDASPGRAGRKEAFGMALAALEESCRAEEKIRSLEAYNAQIRWERDIAIQQLGELGLSLGEKTDSVKEAMKKQKQYRTEYRPYRCPCCSHAWLEDSDATDYPEYCPGCGEPLHPEEEDDQKRRMIRND